MLRSVVIHEHIIHSLIQVLGFVCVNVMIGRRTLAQALSHAWIRNTFTSTIYNYTVRAYSNKTLSCHRYRMHHYRSASLTLLRIIHLSFYIFHVAPIRDHTRYVIDVFIANETDMRLNISSTSYMSLLSNPNNVICVNAGTSSNILCCINKSTCVNVS